MTRAELGRLEREQLRKAWIREDGDFTPWLATEENLDAFPLHKFLHHGLSSQAMLFNLVGPLLMRSDLAPLQHAFEGAGVPWPDGSVAVQLEISDRKVFNEDTGQPTSIDFAVHGAAGAAPLFVETKFTEKEFGGCSVFAGGDCEGRNPAADLPSCYLYHIGRTYWQRAQEHGLLDSPLAAGSICPFASYYQFFRESLFALHQGGHFVLLCDARSPVFFRRVGVVTTLIVWVGWIAFVDVQVGQPGAYWQVRGIATVPLTHGPLSLLQRTAQILVYGDDVGQRLKFVTALIIPLVDMWLLTMIPLKSEVHRYSIFVGLLAVLLLAFSVNNPNRLRATSFGLGRRAQKSP